MVENMLKTYEGYTEHGQIFPIGFPTEITGHRKVIITVLDEIMPVNSTQVERKFSQAKGSHGLALIKTRLKETSLSAIALSIVSLNIAHIVRLLCLIWWISTERKLAVVQ